MRALAILCGLAAVFLVSGARAGAWTQKEGETQILFGVTYSRAVAGFDHHGVAVVPLQYEKELVQLDAEYGWNDWLTLIAEPEFAHAKLLALNRLPERANDAAFEGGARVRLFKDIGIVSVQMTAKTAGAFDMSVSAEGAPGRQLEFRVLYGTNFRLFGRDGFFDAEIAQRWIAGPRADEVPIDLTLGLRVTKRSRLMVQSFNILAEGNAHPPYSYYRVHKVSLAVVTDIRPGLCLESSAYIAAAGQNALAEQGFGIRLWLHF